MTVSRAQFRAFVNRLRLQDRYLGIQGIGYSVRVTPQEVNALVANMQTQGVENFTIRPEFQRNEYHSIIYLEPLDRRNQAAIGFDMFTESLRRAAMERARDTGAPAASGKVTLVQEIDKQKQAGFLIYVPIYRNGAIPDTIAERRAMLTGFAFSPFRADDLMAGILGTEKPTINFQIYDSTVTPENLLHSSISDTQVNGASYQPRFSSTSTINIAGRTWKIAFASHPEFDRSSDENLVPYVFFSGVVVSMVLFGVTRSQARAKDAAEQAVADLRSSEQALRQSEERYRAFIEQSSEGIWCFELEQPLSTKLSVEQQIEHFYQYGYLIECNDVMAQMYGYSRFEEIVGVRLRNLLIDTEPNNIEYLRSFIRSGYRLNAAESHEVDQHGEAKYFLNSLVGIVENGVLVRAWGTQLDITQRKQLEDALKQKSVEREVLLNSIPALVYYKDLASKYIAVNQTFAEIINTPIDKIPGKTDFDFFPTEQAAAFRKDDIEVMDLGDRKWNIEERLTGANGKDDVGCNLQNSLP
jgi:CHASE1-domain containing sensor protein